MKSLPLAIILFATTTCFCQELLPAKYLEKIESMPDFCQADERYGAFPGHGAELCGPTALSNTLVWLNGHGFPKLLPQHSGTLADQAELIRRLAKGEFLDTDLQTGTSTQHLVIGIEKYFKAAGYECRVEQMGWRSPLHRIGTVPDEKWILKSCMGTSNILINVGWYKRHESQYVRHEGHWLTLAGFSEEREHRTLHIHDPGKGSGIEKKTEPCHLVPLPQHHSLTLQKGKPFSADGYFELKGIHIKNGVDLAIIDGAIAFRPTGKR